MWDRRNLWDSYIWLVWHAFQKCFNNKQKANVNSVLIIINVLTFYSNFYARTLNNFSSSMEQRLTTVLLFQEHPSILPSTSKHLAGGWKQTLRKENALKAGRKVSFSPEHNSVRFLFKVRFILKPRINSLFTAVI